MDKEKTARIVKRVQQKLAEIKDYRYPHPPSHLVYGPQHAIWFQTQDDLKAFVSVVNDKYQYEIYNSQTGKSLEKGDAPTLPLAKKEVFKYFKDKATAN